MYGQAVLTGEIETATSAVCTEELDATVENAVRLHSRLVYRIAFSVLRRLMERLIGELPRELAETIRLSTAGELTSLEVGEVLGIPEGTVRTRLLRARGLLREALEREQRGGQRA